MASQYDWMVVPDSAKVKEVLPGSAYSYDLVNMTISEALIYQSRDWGINLSWGDPASSSNVRFQRKGGGGGAIKFGEMFAIGIRRGRWLYYNQRKYGINLDWSEEPKFEWRFDSQDGKAGAVPVMTLVGLYNSVEKDQIMYERRDWGINLKWFKDAGKYDDWGDLQDLLKKVKKAKEQIGEWIG